MRIWAHQRRDAHANYTLSIPQNHANVKRFFTYETLTNQNVLNTFAFQCTGLNKLTN
jgi:hypothetical protein